ncbi:MAG: Gfo/Idh/MocA family oxidoreductase [Bacteroidetes bacterium]|uniref:Gfo/Idh/MocA family oxidoreductase n=1 Tax=Candidatus Enterocola intestinipullorum TaxID=2840783 RepID=A0A9D9HEU1_9BACT|nr:Gfo/Idh/MocA family oxidoreductase [Candidatus Enterocola intestinipullorum]
MIKFAVVGLGHIGKRHAEMIRLTEGAELVAICDVLPKEQIAPDMQEPYFDDFDKMLASDIDIDVVNICNLNGYHAEYAIKALEAKKHVVLEKPIALTKLDAERIVFKSLEMSRSVFCVMQNRYSPPMVWLKSVVDQQLLGKIYLVKVDAFWNRDERYYKRGSWHGTNAMDGGTLFTQFSHYIDMLYWLFGDITNIRGKFANFSHGDLIEFEDTGCVDFEFVNGGMGSLNYSTSVWDKNLESSVTVIGEKGTVKIAGQYMDTVVHCHIKDYEMPELNAVRHDKDFGAYKGAAQNHGYVIENVVQTLQAKGSIATNLLEGMKVVDIIERIYQERDRNF